jgi:hypothetical protein
LCDSTPTDCALLVRRSPAEQSAAARRRLDLLLDFLQIEGAGCLAWRILFHRHQEFARHGL